MVAQAFPFRIAVIGNPETPSALVIGNFLDRLTERTSRRGRSVAIHACESAGPLLPLVRAHAKKRGWAFTVHPSGVAAMLAACDAVAAVPGVPDRATWDAVETAAANGLPVRVLMRAPLPAALVGFPRVLAVSPDICREKDLKIPSGLYY